jgi:hypothetical protein
MSDLRTEDAQPRPVGRVFGMVTGAVAVALFGALGGGIWIRWLWSRTPASVRATVTVLQRRAVVGCAWTTFAAGLVGFAATVRGLLRAFDSTAHVDPSEKARVLALGISDAMNDTAAGLVVQYTGCVVVLVAGWLLLRRAGAAHQASD